MKQAVKLRVLRCSLAVRHLKRVRCVTGLLDEELGEADHLRVRLESFGKVDHLVSGILLVAVTASC